MERGVRPSLCEHGRHRGPVDGRALEAHSLSAKLFQQFGIAPMIRKVCKTMEWISRSSTSSFRQDPLRGLQAGPDCRNRRDASDL